LDEIFIPAGHVCAV